MDLKEFELRLNEWGQHRVPFFFLIDFEMERPHAWTMEDVPEEILFSIGEITNAKPQKRGELKIELAKHPVAFAEYEKKFNFVKQRIAFGDSYLTNLTIRTKIDLNQNLEDLFHLTHAKYKICWKGNFLCFSPEIFVRIARGKVFSFPMKGTIDASLPNAAETIIADQKELSEHVTIVDLTRNDVSSVAADVRVEKFRYIDRISTNQKDLLQVSSEICGTLPDYYHSKLGSILISLLPAGSVSGAPKTKTLEIIREAENEKRGYYTGVAGYFDGENLDTGVMIRFIEQSGDKFYYRSGGGITSLSKATNEYEEAIDKIYVPVH